MMIQNVKSLPESTLKIMWPSRSAETSIQRPRVAEAGIFHRAIDNSAQGSRELAARREERTMLISAESSSAAICHDRRSRVTPQTLWTADEEHENTSGERQGVSPPCAATPISAVGDVAVCLEVQPDTPRHASLVRHSTPRNLHGVENGERN